MRYFDSTPGVCFCFTLSLEMIILKKTLQKKNLQKLICIHFHINFLKKNEKTQNVESKQRILFMIHNMKQGPKIQTHLSWARQREII